MEGVMLACGLRSVLSNPLRSLLTNIDTQTVTARLARSDPQASTNIKVQWHPKELEVSLANTFLGFGVTVKYRVRIERNVWSKTLAQGRAKRVYIPF